MASTNTKPDVVKILTQEAKLWADRMGKYRYEGNLLMAEQALGRQLEAEWLLGVYTGKVKVPAAKKPATKKPAAKKPAAKKPAAKKPAAKKPAAKKPAAKKPAAKKPAAKKPAAPKAAAPKAASPAGPTAS